MNDLVIYLSTQTCTVVITLLMDQGYNLTDILSYKVNNRTALKENSFVSFIVAYECQVEILKN